MQILESTKKRSYSEALKYPSYLERFNYLQLKDNNHDSPRDISQRLYKDPQWEFTRKEIIKRDRGFDLGIEGVKIEGRVLVHHINPIVEEDIIAWNVDKLFNPDNLITCAYDTHNSIHYGQKKSELVERRPGDTKLW